MLLAFPTMAIEACHEVIHAGTPSSTTTGNTSPVTRNFFISSAYLRRLGFVQTNQKIIDATASRGTTTSDTGFVAGNFVVDCHSLAFRCRSGLCLFESC